MTTRISAETIALVALALLAVTGSPALAKECSPLIENTDNCTMTLSTFPLDKGIGGDGNVQSAYSPLAVRVRPSVKVTLNVFHRPFEQVKVTETYNEQAKPDVIGTILSQLGKTAPGLTISTAAFNPPASIPHGGALYGAEIQPPGGPAPTPKEILKQRDRLNDDYNQFVEVTLKNIHDEQSSLQNTLKDQDKLLQDINKEAIALQQFNPELNADKLQWTNRRTFQECVAHLSWRMAEKDSPKPADPCNRGTASPVRDLSIRDLASPTMLQRLLQQIGFDITSAAKQYADLKKRLDDLSPKLKVTERPRFDDAGVQKTLDSFNDRQNVLAEQIKAIPASRAPITAYTDVLNAWSAQYATGAASKDPAPLLQTVAILRHGSNGSAGQQKVDAKVQNQTLLVPAKDPVDVGTASITFVEQRWEVSAGIMWSNVLGRTFQNTPQIKNGQPVLDPNGNQINHVTETTTKPTIDAIALVHYRFIECCNFWNRRIAVLASAGIGTGTNGSGPDFAAGASLAWGNLMLSPLLHFTRDVRLTNGVKVNDNLGPSPPPPPTERYWVHKLGIGLTYVIPLPGS